MRGGLAEALSYEQQDWNYQSTSASSWFGIWINLSKLGYVNQKNLKLELRTPRNSNQRKELHETPRNSNKIRDEAKPRRSRNEAPTKELQGRSCDEIVTKCDKVVTNFNFKDGVVT